MTDVPFFQLDQSQVPPPGMSPTHTPVSMVSSLKCYEPKQEQKVVSIGRTAISAVIQASAYSVHQANVTNTETRAARYQLRDVVMGCTGQRQTRRARVAAVINHIRFHRWHLYMMRSQMNHLITQTLRRRQDETHREKPESSMWDRALDVRIL